MAGGALPERPGRYALGWAAVRDWSPPEPGDPLALSPTVRGAWRLCVGSRFPALLCCGERRLLYYNAAYAPILGDRHPEAFGRPWALVWPELWPVVDPLVRHVFDAGESVGERDRMLLMNPRGGDPEQAYFTFSYSPVTEPDGTVSALYGTVVETTARVLAERRLAALRELAELSTSCAGAVPRDARAALDVLARHREEVPFALLYLPEDGALRVAGGHGLRPGGADPLTHPDWDASISRVAAGGPVELREGLRERVALEPVPGGPLTPDQALILPLRPPGQATPIGVLAAGINPYRRLDEDYRSFLRLVAAQLSTAVTRVLAVPSQRRRAEALAERYAAEQALRRRVELLGEATAAFSAAATPAQVARVAVDAFESLVGTRAVAVWELTDAELLEALDLGDWPESARQDWASLPLDARAPAADAARRREPVWLRTAKEWRAAYPELQSLVNSYGYQAVDCLPLLVGGRCIGVIALGFAEERPLTADDRSGIVALTGQLAQALHRAGLLAEESDARRAAEELSTVSAALALANTPERVHQVLLDHALRMGAVGAVLVLRSSDQLVVAARAGVAADTDLAPLPADAAHPLAHAARTGEPVWLAARPGPVWGDRGLPTAERGAGTPEQRPPVRVAVPLRLAGRPIGALGLMFGTALPVLTAGQRGELRTVADQCAQALERVRLHQAEHEIANTLQRSLLPRALPSLPRLEAAAAYLPAAAGTQAGGDWYDLIELGDDRVGIVVGDVVGNGPPAAAVMGQLRSVLNGYLLDGHGPAAAMERLDRFARLVPGSAASTCACLTLDTRTGELRWTRAGHPPVLVFDGGGDARYLDAAAGTVLGVPGRPPYPEAVTTLGPGCSLLLYTDGLVERRGEPVDLGLGRLTERVCGLLPARPKELAISLIQDALGDGGASDDVALVVLRVLPEPLRMRVPARPEQLRALRDAVRRWAGVASLGAGTLDDLQLALGEAVANSVEHAYLSGPTGMVDVEVAVRPGGAVTVRVADSGAWRPEPADPGFRGRGVRMIHALGSDVSIAKGADGTEVRFTVPNRVDERPAAPPTGPPAVVPVEPARRPALDTSLGPAGARVLALRGDLDLAGVAALRDKLLAAVAGPGPATLDLSRVRYLASAGVGLIVAARERAAAAGRALWVTPPARHTAAGRILALAGLEFGAGPEPGAGPRVGTVRGSGPVAEDDHSNS